VNGGLSCRIFIFTGRRQKCLGGSGFGIASKRISWPSGEQARTFALTVILFAALLFLTRLFFEWRASNLTRTGVRLWPV